MKLEQDLKHVLRRQSPPRGFAGRVMARIEQPEVRRRPVWWRAAAASVTLAAILGGWGAHEVAQRRAEEKAAEQVLQAMQIASEKVRYAQEEVRAIGSGN